MRTSSLDLIILDNYPPNDVWKVFNFVLTTAEEFILDENEQYSKTLTKYLASIKWNLTREIFELNIKNDENAMRTHIIKRLTDLMDLLKPV